MNATQKHRYSDNSSTMFMENTRGLQQARKSDYKLRKKTKADVDN